MFIGGEWQSHSNYLAGYVLLAVASVLPGEIERALLRY